MNLTEKIFRKILKTKVYRLAKRTPLQEATKTSDEIGNRVYIKREDLQDIFSFKIRGAFNAICNLPESSRKNGVICSSAGNHAQGVAASAAKLGIPAYVVMPETTPQIKIQAVKNLGARVTLEGYNLTEAETECKRMKEEMNLAFVHPFDNEDVIAGQGTIGMEIYQELEHIDYVFAPIGGGGLISGIAVYLKSLDPDIRIIGVEPEDSNSMQRAMKMGRRVLLEHPGKFADGVAVPKAGEIPFELCRRLVDEVITVGEDGICSAIKRIYNETRVVVEPAGAVSMAGAVSHAKAKGFEGKRIVTVNSGANMNFDILRHVSRNARVGEGKEILLGVDIPERPGTFKLLCEEVVKGNSITEFNYRYSTRKSAKIFIGLENRLENDKQAVLNSLSKLGFETLDLTEDELSKEHLRFMIGGSPDKLPDERVFLVTFPEKPDALYHFLANMQISWNVTLFHYVNNGGSYSKVFVGFQIPPEDNADLESFLRRSLYNFREQTDNPSYRIFLNRGERY